ncbi:MAG: branched-chain amino acid ABC transporter permease [Alphaproteobacteria bacterium]|nr:branched-chain amino acid ABC transporter permease [Alphaproteobacteria bacterium]
MNETGARPRRLELGIGAAAAALLYLLPTAGFSDYVMAVATSACAYCILAVGLNLVYGYTGLLSLGQVAFWGLGAYVAALAAVDLKWSIWAGVLVGGVIAGISGIAVAFSSLRLSRHAFAIVTLIFALLMQLIARDWSEVTRGPLGIPALPQPTLDLPGLGRFVFDTPARYYVLMLTLALASIVVVYSIVHSRIGRALVAIRDNEALAESQGMNTLHYKLLAVGVSAALAGLAGGLYVFHLSVVDPSIFDFAYTEATVIMVIVGGPGCFWAVIASSIGFSILPEALRVTDRVRYVLYGAILVAAMLVMPKGIGGLLQQRRIAAMRPRPGQGGT